MRRILNVFAIGLLLGFTACSGGGGSSDSGTMDRLEGQWISQNVNANGENTRVTFTKDEAFKVEAYKVAGGAVQTALLDQGSFRAQPGTIDFQFNNGTQVTSVLTFVHDNQIMIDDMTLLRANPDGTIAGGTISGQILINDGSDESASSTASIASSMQGLSISEDPPEEAPEEASAAKQVKRKPLIVRRAKIRDYATIHVLYKDGRRERIHLEKAPDLVESVNAAKNVEQRFQALSTVRKDLEERADEKFELYKNDPNVKHVYKSSKDLNRMKVQSIMVPNDPSYDRQWGMRSVNAPGAWAILDNVTLSDGTVAVIDTGKGQNDDDLPATIFADGWDFISNSGTDANLSLDGNNEDSDETDPGDNAGGPGVHSWHGTHVTGIIAAERNNDSGIAGVNKKAKVMHVRVMGNQGFGDFPDIANGIRYAAGLIDSTGAVANIDPPPAKVINLSIGCVILDDSFTGDVPEGTPTCEATALEPVKTAIEDAIAKGVIVVAAAGNCVFYPTGCDLPFYPANYPDVISVGGLTSHGSFAADFSHYGANQFLTAPSGSLEPSSTEDNAYLGSETQVYSTVYNGWAPLAGTSQAAPFVTGAISAMLSIDGTLTAAQIKTILENTALDMGETGQDDKYGHGVLNIGAAVEQVATDAGKDLSGVDAAALMVSHNNLNYGQVKDQKTVFLHKVGTGALTGLDATKSAPWISEVDLSDTAAPATLTIKVDRSGLEPGSYSSTVSVTSSNGSEDIEVSISVAAPDPESSSLPSGSSGGTEGTDSFDEWLEQVDDIFGKVNTKDTGELIVLLINADTNKPYTGVRTDFGADYRFYFGALPDGNYWVLVGKRTPSDQICDMVNYPDYPCSSYPTYDSPQKYTIQGATVVDNVIVGL